MRKKEILERLWHLHDRMSILERRFDEKERLINDAIQSIKLTIEELRERGDRK